MMSVSMLTVSPIFFDVSVVCDCVCRITETPNFSESMNVTVREIPSMATEPFSTIPDRMFSEEEISILMAFPSANFFLMMPVPSICPLTI